MRDTTFQPTCATCAAAALLGVLLGTLGCGAQGNYSRNGGSGLGPGGGGVSIGSGGVGEGGSGGDAVVGSGGSGDIPIGGDIGGSGSGSGGSGTGDSGTGAVATGGSGSGGSGAAMSGTGGSAPATGGTGTGGAMTGGAPSGGAGTTGTGGASTGGMATGGRGGAATGGTGTGGAGTGGAGTGGMATGGTATGGTGTGGAAAPWILSIDFVGATTNAAGALVPLPTMAATEMAGFKPATHWNSAAGLNGTVPALVSSGGAATAAALTWSSPSLSGTAGIWHLGFADAPGDVRMMNGYLDPSDPAMPGTVAVSGLPASVATSGYDVYVYTLGDISNNPTRTYKYTIGATSFMVSQSGATPTTFGGYKLVQNGAGNYVVFKNVTGTSFTLTATPVSGTQLRAPVNGIQIVAPTGS